MRFGYASLTTDKFSQTRIGDKLASYFQPIPCKFLLNLTLS